MTNPYTLPSCLVQIAFSGGRTSAYMLRKIMDANPGLRDDVVVTFQNTGREMPQTLDFVAEVGRLGAWQEAKQRQTAKNSGAFINQRILADVEI